jgi:hypothetical protein
MRSPPGRKLVLLRMNLFALSVMDCGRSIADGASPDCICCQMMSEFRLKSWVAIRENPVDFSLCQTWYYSTPCEITFQKHVSNSQLFIQARR